MKKIIVRPTFWELVINACIALFVYLETGGWIWAAIAIITAYLAPVIAKVLLSDFGSELNLLLPLAIAIVLILFDTALITTELAFGAGEKVASTKAVQCNQQIPVEGYVALKNALNECHQQSTQNAAVMSELAAETRGYINVFGGKPSWLITFYCVLAAWVLSVVCEFIIYRDDEQNE